MQRANATDTQPVWWAMISKTADYALRLVVLLGVKDGTPAPADWLSSKTQVPRRYLHRVLQDLASADLVKSRSGPGGGYELTRDTGAITILDVINAVSPLERIRSCPLAISSHATLCPLHQELDRAYAANEAAFARVTVKNLLESANPITPLCDIPAASVPSCSNQTNPNKIAAST